jgi:glycosyltransferase involved in cell wall biosynthesis
MPSRHESVVERGQHDAMDAMHARPDTVNGPLRVTVVTETWPPEVNGAALTLARVVRGLQARGHAITLVRPVQPHERGRCGATSAEALAQVLVAGVPIPRYPHLRLGLPCGATLKRLWREHPPHVVHVATEGPLGLSAVLAARQLGLPVTSDFRTNFHAYTSHYGVRWLRAPMLRYLRAFHNRTAATMAPTEALRRALRDEGFRAVHCVSRGVDVDAFNPAHRSAELRRGWQVQADDPVMLYAGRLAAEKNLGLLVRAFHAARAVQPRTRLVLVGDGPLRPRLEASLPEAHFAGQRRGDDLARHFASADLFVFPSLTETFGNVVTEAMASGLAVLAFDDAAAAQLIESGRSGMLVACGNEAQFVRGAAALACSAATREAMGRSARQRALAQGWPAVLDRFEALLRRHAQRLDSPHALGREAPPTPSPASAQRAAPLA